MNEQTAKNADPFVTINKEMADQSKLIGGGERKTFEIGRELVEYQTALDQLRRTTQLEVAAETIKDIKANPEDEKNPIVTDTGKVRFTNDLSRAAEVSRRLELSTDARDSKKQIARLEDELNREAIKTDVARRAYSLMRIQYEYVVLGRRDFDKK